MPHFFLHVLVKIWSTKLHPIFLCGMPFLTSSPLHIPFYLLEIPFPHTSSLVSFVFYSLVSISTPQKACSTTFKYPPPCNVSKSLYCFPLSIRVWYQVLLLHVYSSAYFLNSVYISFIRLYILWIMKKFCFVQFCISNSQ